MGSAALVFPRKSERFLGRIQATQAEEKEVAGPFGTHTCCLNILKTDAMAMDIAMQGPMQGPFELPTT